MIRLNLAWLLDSDGKGSATSVLLPWLLDSDGKALLLLCIYDEDVDMAVVSLLFKSGEGINKSSAL
jgi:hypothetical protein